MTMFRSSCAVLLLGAISLDYLVSMALSMAVSLPKPNLNVKSSLLSGLEGQVDLYVCPESLSPLKRIRRFYGLYEEDYLISQDFKGTKYRVYPGNYIDLTIKSEVDRPVWALSLRERVGQNFFQTRLIPAIYERGYRQNFENIGFPGIDKEFEEANELFMAAEASTVLDLSCGSGFMTRKFVSSNNYGRVIGADLSPTMLEETRRRCQEEGIEVPELVRCDSARLPFESNSIDAVHAGAAMHCWPRLSESLADVYRVLKPGGVFYASTFFVSSIFERASRRMGQTGFYLFESKEEIEDFVSKAGFSGSGGACVVRKEGRGCAIIKAMKAPLPSPDDEGVLADLFSGKTADKTDGGDYDSESTDANL